MGPSKKGLHKANPENQKTEIETHKTKRFNTRVKITPVDNEREFRQMLAQKVSGTSVGLWLLVPELIKLGAWDLLKGWSGKGDVDFAPRIAMQVINETALCVNRVRRKNSLGHQGFQLLNGMGRLVTDEQVHSLLDTHTMEQNKELLINLGIQRQLSGHYQGDLIAIDPHRILTSSKRIMAKKKKDPQAFSQKVLQTFFSLSTNTGQPIMAGMSSSGMPISKTTKELIDATSRIIKSKATILADKEHFTKEIANSICENKYLDLLMPALNNQRIKNIFPELSFKPLWAGFAIAETPFQFENDNKKHRLIVQRLGEKKSNYQYFPFLTTSNKNAQSLICEDYDKRWTVEEFFRFENKLGLNRTSTLNLNIRYGKLALAMITQAAIYQFRKKLNHDYRKWDAEHLANEVFAWSDGDIRANGDTIIITFYGKPKHINPEDYINLPSRLKNQGVNPKVPWLYNYKIDFRFK
jgi:hypothetical protein